ncbi:gas vesicle protein GvpO [Rhodococcus sp. OK519]|uniref:gas vesicle protein GvpO n=1 Tax=Rhodococcus sp. OK519 TaxID=2135729 RepID=UPI000D38460B|nr:gas vesicle protein GvpO [Rhodococcus sp. OK519]
MSGSGDSGDHVDLTAPEAASEAARQIAELTGRTPIGAVSVAPTDEGWSVEVEVLEDRRIPSSSDVMAIYVVVLDLDGMLLSYRRIRQYTRGQSGKGAEQ